jgi:hypothetical protein
VRSGSLAVGSGKPACEVGKACLFELGLVAVVVFNRGDGFVQRDVEVVVELVAGLFKKPDS